MTASDTGRVAVTAATEIVGPGYHRFVGRVLERMGMDLAIVWERGGEEVRDPLTDATAMTFAERPAAERGYLTLARSLAGRGPRAPAVRRGADPARSRRPTPATTSTEPSTPPSAHATWPGSTWP